MQARLQDLVRKHLPSALDLRHDLHRIPEPAGKEIKTSQRIREALAALPLDVRPPFLGTDVVALLDSGRPGPNVTLRADIDALPISEETGSLYASTHAGFMHACGHDGHAAMLYGALRVLCDLRDDLPRGSVRFVFQPGEEVAALARPLLAAGALENPRADFCAALHGWPGVPHGCISTRPGAVMAAAGFFEISITGKGGHGAVPEKALNPIPIASRIVDALRRDCPPICTVCRFDAGANTNIIPASARLLGTTRFLDEETGRRIEDALRSTVERICREEGAAYAIDYAVPYPVTATTPRGEALARIAAESSLAPGRFVPMATSSMTCEDFAYYLQGRDGVYAHLGLGDCPPLHNSHFEFDDSVLASGMAYLATLALQALRDLPTT